VVIQVKNGAIDFQPRGEFADLLDLLTRQMAGAADNRIVIVAINTNTSATSQAFTLSGASATTATPWVTDGTRSLVSQSDVTVSGGGFTYSLPAQSVTSLVIPLTGTGVGSEGQHTGKSIRISREHGMIVVGLDSKESGTLELRTPNGTLVQAREIPAGATQATVSAPERTGLAIVTIRQGGEQPSQAIFQP